MTFAIIAGIVICCLSSSSVAVDQSRLEGMFNRDPALTTFKSADLSFDHPKSGWKLSAVPGSETVIVFLIKGNNEATVAVHRTRKEFPLEASEMTDFFAETERTVIEKQYPGATNIESVLASHPQLGPILQSDYVRPEGNLKYRVRELSVPRGSVLYKAVFSARLDKFKEMQPVFQRMIDSMQIVTPSQPKASR